MHYDFLNLFHPITIAEFQSIEQNFQQKKFKKNEFIITPDEVQTEMYFVCEGIQMSYYESDKKNHVIAFTYPPNLCALPESFLMQQPSRFYLTCLTDTTVYALRYPTLQQIFHDNHNIERLFRKMTEAVLVGFINRYVELHALSMEDRFKAFCARSPQLLHQIPHKYIASYLNIDPTNFSKLFNHIKIIDQFDSLS